jgi:hypothetical protein
MVSCTEQSGQEYMARFIPPPTELAVMARRFAFADQHTVDSLGLDEEYPAEFAYWAERQGFGKIKGYTGGSPDGKEVDFARNTWRIHWNTIAPTLGYQFFQRLRPDRDHFGEDSAFRDLSFGLGDDEGNTLGLKLVLRDSGYTKPFRPLLAAISYRPIGLRQIGNIHYYLSGSQTPQNGWRDWIKQRYQDLGFQADAADMMGQAVVAQNSQKKGQQQLNITRAHVEEAWELGVVNSDSATSLLVTIGYSDLDAQNAVQGWELARVTKLAKKLIAAIRKNYLLGDYTSQEATDVLTQAGVDSSRIPDYIQTWDLDQRQYKLERSVATLTKWFVLGTIDLPNIRQRLQRIGWADEDIERIIVSMEHAAQVASERNKPKTKKPPKPKAFKELSNSEIRELWQQGIIKDTEAISRLVEKGYHDDDAHLIFFMWAKELKQIGPS